MHLEMYKSMYLQLNCTIAHISVTNLQFWSSFYSSGNCIVRYKTKCDIKKHVERLHAFPFCGWPLFRTWWPVTITQLLCTKQKKKTRLWPRKMSPLPDSDYNPSGYRVASPIYNFVNVPAPSVSPSRPIVVIVVSLGNLAYYEIGQGISWSRGVK